MLLTRHKEGNIGLGPIFRDDLILLGFGGHDDRGRFWLDWLGRRLLDIDGIGGRLAIDRYRRVQGGRLRIPIAMFRRLIHRLSPSIHGIRSRIDRTFETDQYSRLCCLLMRLAHRPNAGAIMDFPGGRFVIQGKAVE